jgi:hypothetical protein
MKRLIILATAAAAATLIGAAPADAQRWHGNWRTVGFKTVNGRDTDTIHLPGTARYRQMRLCVYGGPIEMRDLDVRYRNGGHQDIAVRAMIRGGSCTRNIDLAGNRRDVTLIRMKYAPLARGWAHPTVRVQVR